MALKGKAVIELKNVRTGDVLKIEKENMVTDAVTEILRTNPIGTFYRNANDLTEFRWDQFLPICPKLIGGILLYGNALTEETSNIYPSSENIPVAYASNTVNSGRDLQRGSLNQTESRRLDNGYQFVWDFNENQGNGQIAALALTSAQGGINGYGSSVASKNTFLNVQEMTSPALSTADVRLYNFIVEMDFERETAVSIAAHGQDITITKFREPVFSLTLNDRFDDSDRKIIETREIHCSTFNMIYDVVDNYGQFLDGKDGYWYGFSNRANSSGNAELYWVRISKSDYSFQEGIWTLTGAKLAEVGLMCDPVEDPSYTDRSCRSCIRNGYLYVMANNKKGVYQIRLMDPTDIRLINLGFTSAWHSFENMGSGLLHMTVVGDIIYGCDFMILADNTVVRINVEDKLSGASTPLFQYKEFLIAWSGESAVRRVAFILTPFQATINNLESAVTKTTDQTMRITYTLIEE